MEGDSNLHLNIKISNMVEVRCYVFIIAEFYYEI